MRQLEFLPQKQVQMSDSEEQLICFIEVENPVGGTIHTSFSSKQEMTKLASKATELVSPQLFDVCFHAVLFNFWYTKTCSFLPYLFMISRWAPSLEHLV